MMTEHLPFLLSLVFIVASFLLGRRMSIEQAIEPSEIGFFVDEEGQLGIEVVLMVDGKPKGFRRNVCSHVSKEIAETIAKRQASSEATPVSCDHGSSDQDDPPRSQT